MQIDILVSIIMPAFNSSHYISMAIDSVLRQNYHSWELIIVDGESTDQTTFIVSKFIESDPRIKLITNENDCGPAHARANGIRRAQGKYIAFIDADDLWYSDKLEKQVSLMEQNNYFFTYTLYRQISADGLNSSAALTARKSYSFPGYLGCRGIGNLTVMLRAEVFTPQILNIFKYRAEDMLWWLLIMRSGITAYLLPEVLAYYRITPGSLSRQRAKHQLAVWRSYREIIGLNRITCFYYYNSYIADVLLRKLKLWYFTLLQKYN
jgi:teichuronic acid biosynthesis glycosyltransferase TuaG